MSEQNSRTPEEMIYAFVGIIRGLADEMIAAVAPPPTASQEASEAAENAIEGALEAAPEAVPEQTETIAVSNFWDKPVLKTHAYKRNERLPPSRRLNWPTNRDILHAIAACREEVRTRCTRISPDCIPTTLIYGFVHLYLIEHGLSPITEKGIRYILHHIGAQSGTYQQN